jgi:hypothetical protein
MLLWVILQIADQSGVFIKGRNLEELHVEGGSETDRQQIEVFINRLQFVERIIADCQQAVKLASEFAAIDFAEGVFRTYQPWQFGGDPDQEGSGVTGGLAAAWKLRRRGEVPVSERLYPSEQDKREQAYRVIRQHAWLLNQNVAFEKELREAWECYNAIEDDRLRQEIILLCMGSTHFIDGLGVQTLDLSKTILECARLAQHGSEIALEAIDRARDDLDIIGKFSYHGKDIDRLLL